MTRKNRENAALYKDSIDSLSFQVECHKLFLEVSFLCSTLFKVQLDVFLVADFVGLRDFTLILQLFLDLDFQIVNGVLFLRTSLL